MGVSFLRQLKKDKQDLEEALSEQEEIVAKAQATIFRLDGAITYVTKLIEHLEKKEVKKDASSS